MATAKKKNTEADTSARTRKLNRYKSFRLSKRIPHPAGPLPTTMYIVRQSLKMLWANKRVVLILIVLFGILNLALVRGFTSPLNVTEVKAELKDFIGNDVGKTETTFTILGRLLGTTTPSTESSGLYLTILVIIFGLALIWVFRQWSVGKKPTVRGAFYKGMYPLIPMVLVIGLMALECVPAIFATGLYSATVTSGVAANGYEKAIWIILTVLLIILALYLLFSSLFAIFVVTLPDMTPMKALRTSRQLVFSRRLNVLRKLLVLPIGFLVLLVVLVVPTIYFAAAIAPWLYFFLTTFGILYVYAYLFTLYKELI